MSVLSLVIVIILPFNSTDPELRQLALLAERRQATALRPGTRANHRSVLAKFVRFCVKCRLHFTNPTDEVVCMFFEHCLASVKSAATIKNYAAGLTTSYHQMGLDTTAFEAYKVRLALKSIEKNVRHVPSPAPPVSPNLLKKVVKVAARLPEGPTVVAALVVMYHTFFRQSNLAAQSSTEYDHTRQLAG